MQHTPKPHKLRQANVAAGLAGSTRQVDQLAYLEACSHQAAFPGEPCWACPWICEACFKIKDSNE